MRSSKEQAVFKQDASIFSSLKHPTSSSDSKRIGQVPPMLNAADIE
jgi:hypothetical protein